MAERSALLPIADELPVSSSGASSASQTAFSAPSSTEKCRQESRKGDAALQRPGRCNRAVARPALFETYADYEAFERLVAEAMEVEEGR
jgi:hypothetical protein